MSDKYEDALDNIYSRKRVRRRSLSPDRNENEVDLDRITEDKPEIKFDTDSKNYGENIRVNSRVRARSLSPKRYKYDYNSDDERLEECETYPQENNTDETCKFLVILIGIIILMKYLF